MDSQHANRQYRRLHQGKDLVYFQVKLKESDLDIGVDAGSYSDSLIDLCRRELIKIRGELESYILLDPAFQYSLFPVETLPGATPLVVRMAEAARAAGVGPMAAVAGAVAQAIGEVLTPYAQEIIVENGGDIYLQGRHERIVAVFAGNSPFSHRIGIKIAADEQPLGICTSSGTVGHSLSLGRADAIVIKGYPAALADAVATRAGNQIHSAEDLMKGIDAAKDIPGVTGALAVKNDKMAAWGVVELVAISGRSHKVDRRSGNQPS